MVLEEVLGVDLCLDGTHPLQALLLMEGGEAGAIQRFD